MGLGCGFGRFSATKAFQKEKFEGIWGFFFPLLFQQCQGPLSEGLEALPPRAPAPSPLDIPRVLQAGRALARGEIPSPVHAGTFRPRGFRAAGLFRVRHLFIGSIRTRRAQDPKLPPGKCRDLPAPPTSRPRSAFSARLPPRVPKIPGVPKNPCPARRGDPGEGSPLPAPPSPPPTAISAPKSSLSRRELIRNCRPAWGMLGKGEEEDPAGKSTLGHPKFPWIGARHPKVLRAPVGRCWAPRGTLSTHGLVPGTPKHPWDGAGCSGTPRASVDDDGSIPPPHTPQKNPSQGQRGLWKSHPPPFCHPRSDPATIRARGCLGCADNKPSAPSPDSPKS